MKVKKVPMRTCVGCGEQKTKKELIRVVKNNENQVFVDFKGKANGRGAYICPSLECLKKAQKRDALSRSLMTKIDHEIYERLAEELAAGDQSEPTADQEKDE
jgi:hypothetical protein